MKFRLFCFLLTFISVRSFSQNEDFTPSGKAFATIFANFHTGIQAASSDEAAFELERGYIGYEYNFSPEFYAKINLDIGSPNDLSPYSKLRRYAYFKNAFLRYTKDKLVVEFGLIGTKQFKLQEKTWGRRYIMKSFADEYKLGSSADLGISFTYNVNDLLSADFSIINGEGYNNVQTDNIFKYCVGTTFKFPSNFTSRLYYDFAKNELTESTYHFFTSYNHKKKWNLAGEFILRDNNGWNENQQIWGLSFYGSYSLTNQYQLFARFDEVRSNELEGDTSPWNLADDGTALVAGIQFNPIKNIKIALNYHDWYPWAANQENEAFIFLNLEVKM